MPEDVRRRAVEPFFTTKSRGLSTGLGLSLVHGIAQTAGGSLAIDSEPGRGTAVTLALPAADGDPAMSGTADIDRPIAMISLHQPRLRALCVSMLELFGYRAQVTVDGADSERSRSALWLLDAANAVHGEIEEFLSSQSERQAAYIGDADSQLDALGCIHVGAPPQLTPAALRARLKELFGPRRRAESLAR